MWRQTTSTSEAGRRPGPLSVAGNDAAIALSEGARHVDTVEIDPLLVRLGNMHPNHPYSSPRLTAHVDDGPAGVTKAMIRMGGSADHPPSLP